MASRPAMTVEELIRRKVASLRYWKKTKLYKKHSNWKFQFSVMTYNILSQNAIENHRFLYRNCNPSFLMEDYRVSRILPEILHSRSDIICLQEVEEYVYETRMKSVFEMNGFGTIFMRRTCNRTDGCAIMWRREKFQLVSQNGIEFRTRKSQLLDRDNIGLIAVLRPNHRNAENIRLHIATTHLLFNPKRGDIKLCQLRWLLAELDQMALIEVKDEIRHYHPIILCGDFNFEPFSPLYQFVENGRIHVTNAMSGDLSGQAKGQNSGRIIKFENLLLHKLGISDASRFEKIPPKRKTSQKPLETNSNQSPIPATDSINKTDPNTANSKVIGETNQDFVDSEPIGESKPNLAVSEYMDVCDAAPTKEPEIIATAFGGEQLETEIHPPIQSDIKQSEEMTKPSSNNQEDVAPTKDSESIATATAFDGKQLETEVHAQIQSDTKQSEEMAKPGFNLVNDPTEETESTECFSHDFKFVPAYKFHNANQKPFPVTTMVGTETNAVDHIFYNVDSKENSHSYREGALKLLSVYTLMNAEDLKELGGLPNAGFGSDHISLGAQFGLCFHNRRH